MVAVSVRVESVILSRSRETWTVLGPFASFRMTLSTRIADGVCAHNGLAVRNASETLYGHLSGPEIPHYVSE